MVDLPNDWHVMPIGDLRDHSDTRNCWCRPSEDDGVWIHHSMDRREYSYEKGLVQ